MLDNCFQLLWSRPKDERELLRDRLPRWSVVERWQRVPRTSLQSLSSAAQLIRRLACVLLHDGAPLPDDAPLRGALLQLVSLPPAFRQRVSLQRVFVLRCAGLRLRERVALPVRAPVALLPPASVLLHEQVALPVRVRVVLLLPVPVALRVRVRRPRAARLPSALSLPSLPSLAALSVAAGAQPPAAVPLVSACA